jgi:hypothetical protein
LLIGTLLVAQPVSDGPMGPFGGGPLRSGKLVSEPNVDWSFLGGGGEIEHRAGFRCYERQAVRVTDPELLATLSSITEERAKQYLSSLGGLLDVPGDPEAIWFLRMDPRPVAINPGRS